MNYLYEVKLDTFEGPLDLLLHLINDLEIDIYDIPVAEITEQYMDYIIAMQQIELNIASEYLVMAATLLEIKSSMLLPKKELEIEDEYEEDPREILIKQLIEYKRFKHAAEVLEEKELDENQLYTRPPILFEELKKDVTVVQGDVSMNEMVDALANVFKRMSWNEPLETRVSRLEITIEERMEEIMEVILSGNKAITFDRLFPYPNRAHIVTTFLAILQLIKQMKIVCEQEHHFQPILIRPQGEV